MKKFLLILTALFAMMSVNAQDENNTLVSLLKLNFEGVTPKYMPTGDNPMTVEGTADGLALTNPTLKAEGWAAQTGVITDFDLEQSHNYIVRLTMKVPSDGTYIVRMGNWDASSQYELPVAGSDDWQVIDVQFPDFCADIKTETGNLMEN